MKMEYVELGEVCEIRNGFAFKSSEYKDKGIPLIRISNFDAGKVSIDENTVFMDNKYLKEKPDFIVEKGDILIALSGATTGKYGIYDEGYPSLLNQRIGLLKSGKSQKLYSKFFYFYLAVLKKEILRTSGGAAQPNISTKVIEKFKIPLPPLEEQQRIARLLDEADRLRQLDKALIEKYDALTQSLFFDMFGDPVTNPKGWDVKTIEELIKDEKYSLKRGPFGGALKKEVFVEKGYLVYEQYHALNNDFNFERYYIDEEKFNELKAFRVKPKDIIISCSGVYLGKLAIVPENSKKGIINQALLKISLDEGKMRNDFFVFHFSQKRFKETFFSSNRGAGIPNFPPMKEFKKFPFICPPIALQNQFAERVAIIEQQKQQAQEALQKSEDLFNGLLQDVFRRE